MSITTGLLGPASALEAGDILGGALLVDLCAMSNREGGRIDQSIVEE
jgi:hypothetical protein